MLTYEDCVDFSGLTSDQLEVISRELKLDGVSAVAWATAAASSPEGRADLQSLLGSAVAQAIQDGNRELAFQNQDAFEAFVQTFMPKAPQSAPAEEAPVIRVTSGSPKRKVKVAAPALRPEPPAAQQTI